MPRKPIGDKPMTPAERQSRSRKVKAARSAEEVAAHQLKAERARFADRRTMTKRWNDAVWVLNRIQANCACLPKSHLASLPRPDAYAAILALDLSALSGAADSARENEPRSRRVNS